MKKLIVLFMLTCIAVNVDAQRRTITLFSTKNMKKSSSSSSSQSQPAKAKVSPPNCKFLPELGIEEPDVPYEGSPGSEKYKRKIQEDVREEVTSSNRDATRFLENAVKENNVEKIEKLLKAGASAYITFDMIKNKQYQIIDLMYKSNPKLIRYSQLLHYACEISDSTMIDFLIERNASLDLNGYHIRKDNLYVRGSYYPQYLAAYSWNSNSNYRFTPIDNALWNGRDDNIKYVIKKYGKYPTLLGWAMKLWDFIYHDNLDRNYVDYTKKWITNLPYGCKDYTIKDLLNTGYYWIKNGTGMEAYNNITFNFPLVLAVQKLAEYRSKKDAKGKAATAAQKAKQYEELIRMMIDAGADVNIGISDYHASPDYGINNVGSDASFGKTPMFVAMTRPGMLDIIKLLRSKGAYMYVYVDGKKTKISSLRNCLDEYKEYLLLEGL